MKNKEDILYAYDTANNVKTADAPFTLKARRNEKADLGIENFSLLADLKIVLNLDLGVALIVERKQIYKLRGSFSLIYFERFY